MRARYSNNPPLAVKPRGAFAIIRSPARPGWRNPGKFNHFRPGGGRRPGRHRARGPAVRRFSVVAESTPVASCGRGEPID